MSREGNLEPESKSAKADDHLRLFAAVELPEEWLSALAGAGARLEKAGDQDFKWVKTDLMHLTLVFLGSQNVQGLPAISSALSKAAARCRPFGCSLGQLGAFGPPQAVSVVWAGLAETPTGLKELHSSVVEELAAGQIAFDQKPLSPHITISRCRRPINREASLRVSALLARLPLPRLTTTVNRFVLLRSKLSPAGPTYESIGHFGLGGDHGS